MRQAIETHYIRPTNHRGSRVVARAQVGRVTVSWDHSISVDENHDAARAALCARFGWDEWTGGRWAAGGRADMRGNVYVWHEE